MWYNIFMHHDIHHHSREIIKSTLGFIGILFVGLVGVGASQIFKLGDVNTLITTVDNVAQLR